MTLPVGWTLLPWLRRVLGKSIFPSMQCQAKLALEQVTAKHEGVDRPLFY